MKKYAIIKNEIKKAQKSVLKILCMNIKCFNVFLHFFEIHKNL